MLITGIRFNLKLSYHKHAIAMQLSTIQHHGIFSTGEGGLNMLEGFGQNFPYLLSQTRLAVTIWALITDSWCLCDDCCMLLPH